MVEVAVEETCTSTVEEDSIVDELVWTELCTGTTDINVELEGPEVGLVKTEDGEEVYESVLGVALTDDDSWVFEAVADDDPPAVPEGEISRA